MIAKHKILNAIEDLKQLSVTTGLTDAQVIWVKDKMAQIEAWKDTAVTEIVSIKARLNTLENKVATLETKAAQAVTKFNQIDNKIAAIEARLTAHGI